MVENIPPEISVGAAGAVGSTMALRWVTGDWRVKLAVWLSSCSCAVAGALFVNWYYGMKSVAALALIAWGSGLLGMLVVEKLAEFIRAVNVGELWIAIRDWIRVRLGLQKL